MTAQTVLGPATAVQACTPVAARHRAWPGTGVCLSVGDPRPRDATKPATCTAALPGHPARTRRVANCYTDGYLGSATASAETENSAALSAEGSSATGTTPAAEFRPTHRHVKTSGAHLITQRHPERAGGRPRPVRETVPRRPFSRGIPRSASAGGAHRPRAQRRLGSTERP